MRAAEAGADRAYQGGLKRLAENPTADTLDKVAEALDVPLGELFVAPAEGATPPAPLREGGRRR